MSWKKAEKSIEQKSGYSKESADKVLGKINAEAREKASHGGHVANKNLLKKGGHK